MPSDTTHFSSLLLSLRRQAPEDRISLSFISQTLGNRSTGALLLFLALPMVLPILPLAFPLYSACPSF